MNLNDAVYIGIDPASGNKDFSYAVLDNILNLVELADADLEELIVILEKRDSSYVAINAPSGVNRGLVKGMREQEQSTPGRSTLRGADIRLAEYELRERGIDLAGTPSREEFCPAWMQAGFALFQHLLQIGFKPDSGEDVTRHVFETQPHVCYSVLVEDVLFPRSTLEGQLQRQLVLFDRGLRIRDAMGFFEEVTRFKLMRGILPTEVLYLPEQLDVLVAAYTAWLAANRPGEVTRVGDQSEGQILLPVREMKSKY